MKSGERLAVNNPIKLTYCLHRIYGLPDLKLILGICLAIPLCLGALNAGADDQVDGRDGYVLERVVVVMRHGVRPPTKPASTMAPLTDAVWPTDQAWGAEPGELTPHGGLAIRRLGTDLRNYYAGAGLFSASGSMADQTLIWADRADQRTRETGRMLATGLDQDHSHAVPVVWSKAIPDPLFDALSAGVCKLNPDQAQKAVLATGSLESPKMSAALAKMQTILAPTACQKGAGICLAGPSELRATEQEVKIAGPLSTGATVSEVFLLEYENGMPMTQVGFGRATAGDIEQLLAIHEYTSNLTRRTAYIATRRAYVLTKFILAALAQDMVKSTAPEINSKQRMIVVVGHDTNLSNLAGVFGLEWHMPDQPDVTAPGTTIAFERWRDQKSGRAVLKMRLFYQTMEQVRNLSDTPLRQLSIQPAACRNSASCEVSSVVDQINALLPKDCAE